MLAAYRCRYVFPVTSPPIENGVVTVDDDSIVYVGRQAAETGIIHELGNVAVVPRFVNAHTHLEYSRRADPFGSAGMPFYAWIEEIVEARRSSPPSLDDRVASYQAGMGEMWQDGTAVIGDIAPPDWPKDALDDSLQGTIFLELLGLRRDRSDVLVDLAREHLDLDRLGGSWRAGLSPHAPYTVHPELLSELCRLSAESRVPVAMHLAESFEEIELITSGSGPFVEMLSRLEAWDPTAIPRGLEVMYYLEKLSSAHRALVIHGNYLQEEEISFLAGQPQMSVVYCPRTHAFFEHGEYPLQQLLEGGVRLALGTDSRGSNPDLSLLLEMKFLAANADLDPAVILRVGTLAGAEALGVDSTLGSLEAGKSPLAAVIALPHQEMDAAAALFHPDSRVTHLIDGRQLVLL